MKLGNEGYRERDSEDGKESQGAGFDAGGRRQGFVVAVGEESVLARMFGHLGDQNRHGQTNSEQEVDDSPEPLDAANSTREDFDPQGGGSEDERVQHETQGTGAHTSIVGLSFSDGSAVDLTAHPVGVEEKEGEPRNPVETRHQEKDPHGTLQFPKRTE